MDRDQIIENIKTQKYEEMDSRFSKSHQYLAEMGFK
jgi:hypothetical protein